MLGGASLDIAVWVIGCGDWMSARSGRPRAWGDAQATAEVLTMAIEKEGMAPIHYLLAKKEGRKKIAPLKDEPSDASSDEEPSED